MSHHSHRCLIHHLDIIRMGRVSITHEFLDIPHFDGAVLACTDKELASLWSEVDAANVLVVASEDCQALELLQDASVCIKSPESHFAVFSSGEDESLRLIDRPIFSLHLVLIQRYYDVAVASVELAAPSVQVQQLQGLTVGAEHQVIALVDECTIDDLIQEESMALHQAQFGDLLLLGFYLVDERVLVSIDGQELARILQVLQLLNLV